MKQDSFLSAILTTLVIFSSGLVIAADQDRTQMRQETQQQIYGSSMMTDQERSEYRARMRNAKTAEERQQIRNEHHERMQERAKSRGITLPDTPPARGGMGQGNGMGQGGGMRKGGGGGM